MKAGSQELIHGNCLFHMENSSSELFDVVITSPPYNIGMKYNSFEDNLKPIEYFHWFCQVAWQIKRLMKPDGSFFLNIGSKPTDPMTPFKIVMMLTQIFELQNTFHWIKAITVGDTSTGHYKPVQSSRFVNNCHEYIFHFTKNGNVPIERKAIGVPYVDKKNVERFNNPQALRCRGNTWFIPYKTTQSKKDRNHPATFPEKLVEDCLKLHGLHKFPTVLDPFSGTGTTALVCEKLKLKSVGYEIDEYYLNQSVERVNKEHGRK